MKTILRWITYQPAIMWIWAKYKYTILLNYLERNMALRETLHTVTPKSITRSVHMGGYFACIYDIQQFVSNLPKGDNPPFKKVVGSMLDYLRRNIVKMP